MAPASAYLTVSDRRESAALKTALERTIAQAQTLGFQDKDSLVRAIISDLSYDDESVASLDEPIWKSWNSSTYEIALECVKVLSRSPAGSSHLSSSAGIKTLAYHAKYSPGDRTTEQSVTMGQQHAVSALCNTLLLHQNAPALCVKERLGNWALAELAAEKNEGADQTWRFLMARMIMVLTSRATYGFLESLVDDLNGLGIIKARLEEVLEHPDQQHLALVDYMKILYHIFALYPEIKGTQWDQRFHEFCPLLLDLLLACPTEELAPPVTNIINVLTRFSPDALRNTVESKLMQVTMKIFRITAVYVEATLPPPPWKPGEAVTSPGYDQQLVENLDQVLPPPLLVLVNLMTADQNVKQKIKENVIPADLDRSVEAGPLEERANILGYLLRLSRSAINHMTATAVGEVLWVLCGENASTMTTEIGYGNAAGVLFNKGMGLPPKPEATVEEIPDEPTRPVETPMDEDKPRDPITGLHQTADAPENPMAEMSQEEKEREAERLMALFDRTERNPAMKLVENPMKDAVRSGKIEEWEKSEQEQELQRIREQEAADEAEAAREVSDWKKRMGRSG